MSPAELLIVKETSFGYCLLRVNRKIYISGWFSSKVMENQEVLKYVESKGIFTLKQQSLFCLFQMQNIYNTATYGALKFTQSCITHQAKSELVKFWK